MSLGSVPLACGIKPAKNQHAHTTADRVVWAARCGDLVSAANMSRSGQPIPLDRAKDIARLTNNLSVRGLSNTTYNLAEPTIHISDFGSHASSQVAHHERGHIAHIFDGHIAADGG